MNIFALISTILLAVMLFWAVYHVRIIFAGIRAKRKQPVKGIVISDNKLPTFSLIVPAKDEAYVINRCLNSLTNLNYPKDKFEIIVVAGASKDDTQKLCQDFSKNHPDLVKVFCEESSKGKPTALNVAFTHANGELIGVFDADSVPEHDVLKRAADYFANPSISAVQGNAFSLNESQNMLTTITAAEDKAWFQGLLHGRESLGLFVAFTGSCQFIRSNVLKEMNGWEKSALAEDVELSLKMAKNGHFVKFAPDICSGQETPFSLRGLITQRIRWYRGYMEASLKYSSLLDSRINKKVIDAELSLIGPFVMIVCLASYINWGLNMAFSPNTSLFPFSATLAILLTSVTLISVGVSMAYFVKPAKARNVLWIPFIYAYWFMQMLIAFWAFLLLISKRQRVWSKTAKSGFLKADFASNNFAVASLNVGRVKVFPRKLNVCFISSYPPNRARLSEYTKNLVNALSQRPSIGQIYLLADKAADSRAGSAKTLKTKVLRVWEPDNPLSILRTMFYVFKLKPDVVHFNISFTNYGYSRVSNFVGLFLIRLCRFFGFKVLVEAHALGDKFDLEKAHFKPNLLNRIGILMGTKLILSAPKVVVTVRSYVDFLKSRYGYQSVQFIPHGTSENTKDNAGLPLTTEKVILIFGHMGPNKGLPIMLEAFKELSMEQSDVQLVVAGTNHPCYKNYLTPFINAHQSNVHFTGYIPEENIGNVFLSADVVVLPYLASPGTSGVFHLACGYGRPIVASDLPEIREMVTDGASALLVPPENPKALTDAIAKILKDKTAARKMSKQNLEFARRETWSTVAEDYEKAYLELSAS